MATNIASYEDLIALLQADGVLHESHAETRSVNIPTGRGALRGVLVLRWQPDRGVATLIQSLPMTVPPDRVAAFEAGITRLNHALLLPGFGLSPSVNVPYYRLLLPLFPDQPPRAEHLRTLFRVTVKTAADYLPALRRVALEGGNPETIVEDASVDIAMGEGQSQ